MGALIKFSFNGKIFSGLFAKFRFSKSCDRMGVYVFPFREIDKTKLVMVGGKGGRLAELSRIEGIRVPDGFCVTTEAYRQVTEANRELDGLLDELAGHSGGVSEICGRIRRVIESIPIPDEITEEVANHLTENGAWAVRSSATAEDLPAASFAGQQDTYLNIIGKEAVLRHISRCWASLFTDRAVIYRIQNGFDHRQVSLCVVVQRMVFPEASGILFTADPVSSNRKVLSIDAGFGLGEALVSGLVSADNYIVREGEIADRRIAVKKLGIYRREGGGTETRQIEDGRQHSPALTDEQILRLACVGRKIEAYLGSPQDIEWCMADDVFYVVQSRPITTLYPIPAANDAGPHVYISVGHQQMMTDAMKPLGISFWQLTTFRPMSTAGGRLFVDVAQNLATAGGRNLLIDGMGRHDPLIKTALMTIVGRDFVKLLPDDGKGDSGGAVFGQTEIQDDPAIVDELIGNCEVSLTALKERIRGKSGPEVFDFIREDIQELRKVIFDPRTMPVIMTALNAYSWINDNMDEWLGEKGVADALSLSVPNNVTSEMGLALLDVADVIRPFPGVIAYLQRVNGDPCLHGLAALDGGEQARRAIYAFIDKYGMRCSGEIDITRTRWSERPATLVPMILSNIRNFEAGAACRKWEIGRQEASKKERELLERLMRLPDGDRKVVETKGMIRVLRNFIGYREYPKYGIVSRYWVYKQALLAEAERLVEEGVIGEKEDMYYLSLEEFAHVVRSRRADKRLLLKRKAEFRSFEKLTPPRVMTSDGEVIMGEYKTENLPAGAIVGLAVSSGIIEGRARVILRMEDADLEEGDILVTAFTDPSWTALFVSIRGLVTEVGGLMTHGAVIAREYGLPAVVGVEHATDVIRDGQLIRVNGTEGYVEILAG